MTNLCPHSLPEPLCRTCTKAPDTRIPVPNSTLKMHPPKQKPRKEMKRSKSKRPKMSADAKVQDAMLGRGRCYVADGMSTDCTDGYSQRSHIVKQTVISEAFEFGAVSINGKGWKPAPGPQDGITWLDHDGSHMANLHIRTLQTILDDTRNIVPTCPNHNVDGLAMVEALGIVGLPPGFDDFCREYQFVFSGRFWFREATRIEAA
jgi:hypothetical protein